MLLDTLVARFLETMLAEKPKISGRGVIGASEGVI